MSPSVPTFWQSRWETRKPTVRKKWRMWKAAPRAAISELESEEEGKQWAGKDKGRPNFKRAAAGAGQ